MLPATLNVSTVESSDVLWIVIFPLSTLTISLKVRTIFALSATPVASSAGTDELNIGSVKPISNGASKSYECTSAPPLSVTNILVPSLLKAIPLGVGVWLATLKPVPSPFPSTKLADDTSKPVVKVYSFISLPSSPTTNILVPSLLKAIPLGVSSSSSTSKLSIKFTVDDKSKPVDNVYSFTSSPVLPTTNILVPSLLKATLWGSVSWELTLKLSIKFTVDDKSKPVDNVYSCILFSSVPTTNILVPSLLKAKPLGAVSWALTIFVAWILEIELADISKPVSKSYSSTLSKSEEAPPEVRLCSTNIFSPLPLKAIAWGLIAVLPPPVPTLAVVTFVGPACAELTKVRLKIKNIENIENIFFIKLSILIKIYLIETS